MASWVEDRMKELDGPCCCGHAIFAGHHWYYGVRWCNDADCGCLHSRSRICKLAGKPYRGEKDCQGVLA